MTYAIFHEVGYEGGWLEWFDTLEEVRDRIDQLRADNPGDAMDFRVLEVSRELDYDDVVELVAQDTQA